MYDLYKNAKICFTYLADVPSDDNPSKRGSTFEKSRWFTRGWTLQELLAPSEVIFFSKEWMEIGRKTTMPSLLARITGIDEDILIHRKPIESASVATRMSWAANRQTTFVEDRAYSLMGIFGVSIPKLYWQDANAFIQLQQEIISRCNDHSIFAWTDTKASPSSPHGLLATSPSFFAGCHDIVSCNGPAPALPYTVANGILDITLPLHAIDNSTFAVALNCQLESESQTAGHLALYLKRVSEKDETYARIKVGSLAEVVERGPMKKIHVRESLTIKNDKGEFSSQASQPIKHSHFLSRSATKASVDNGKTKKPFWKLRFFRKWSNKFLVYSVAFCKSYSV
ncbi:hypothetical protein MW887_007170 [Aspergillus wentii]|nr:hypothetical protein MW887_007170 [Aspergillus wentii]